MGEQELEIARAIISLRAAIENPGRNPTWHRVTMARHREEWPTLWTAIDRLLYAEKER